MTAYSQTTFYPAVGRWYFADVSALELTAEYHGLLRRVVLLSPLTE